jgi:hypothetical protein
MEDGEERMCAPTRVFSTVVVAMNPSPHTLSLSPSLSTFQRTFTVANRRRSGSSLLCLRVVAQVAAEDVSDCYWVSGKIDKCSQH